MNSSIIVRFCHQRQWQSGTKQEWSLQPSCTVPKSLCLTTTNATVNGECPQLYRHCSDIDISHLLYAVIISRTRGWALDRVHNSRRPLDRLCTLWSCDLDLWPFDSKIIMFVGYPKVILYTKFEYFGITLFELSCGQTDRLTDWQKDAAKRFTPASVVGVSN